MATTGVPPPLAGASTAGPRPRRSEHRARTTTAATHPARPNDFLCDEMRELCGDVWARVSTSGTAGWVCRWDGWSGGGSDSDGVSELFQLVHEVSGEPLGVSAALVVVGAEVGESLPGGEHVPGDVDQTVGDGDGGLVGSSAAGDLAILGAEVAAFRSGSGV